MTIRNCQYIYIVLCLINKVKISLLDNTRKYSLPVCLAYWLLKLQVFLKSVSKMNNQKNLTNMDM